MTQHESTTGDEAGVIRVGLLGCGIVGSAVCRQLDANADSIARRTGLKIELAAVAVRSLAKDRDCSVPKSRFTTDAASVVNDPQIDVVVEVIGGIEPARTLILQALSAGKPVVTANKELVSTLGSELFEAAASAGRDLLFEAAVGGGIPIIRPLRDSLAGDRITKVVGILNGTTNYVLTKMAEEGVSLHEAVAEAQELGYAERDPTADVEGYDAAAKTAILAGIAFDTRITQGDVYREGITGITEADMQFANRLGYVIKLLSIAEFSDGEVQARVHPAMIPKSHPLASVRESFNAIFVETQHAGQLMFFGRGAGGGPTATSVTADILEAARHLRFGGEPASVHSTRTLPVRSFDETTTQYYLLLEVADRPGVLAKIASCFGAHGVSIASVWQEGHGETAQLVIVTHTAREKDFQATLHDVRTLDVVSRVVSVLRVEDEEEG
jgi:homoserine dehydrogenase